MPQNDFLIFNQNNNNTLTQTEFQSDSQRIDGLQGGIARSKIHNKILRQASIAVNALSRLIIDSGNDALDTDPESYYINLKSVIAQVQQATEQIAGTVTFASNADVDSTNPSNENTANDTKSVTLRKIVRGIKNKKLIQQAKQDIEGVTRFATSGELVSANPPEVGVSANVIRSVLKNQPDNLIKILSRGAYGLPRLIFTGAASNPEDSVYDDNGINNFNDTKQMIKWYLQDTSFIANATTSKSGKIRIATYAEANAGTDNSTAITPYLLKQLRESGILGGVKSIQKGNWSCVNGLDVRYFNPINSSKSIYLVNITTWDFSKFSNGFFGPLVTLYDNRIEFLTSSGSTQQGTWQVIEYY